MTGRRQPLLDRTIGIFRQNPYPTGEPPQHVLSDALNQNTAPVLLTLDEAAAVLGISVKSVQRRIRAGVIRKAPLGGRLVRISSDELRRLTGGGLVLSESEDAEPD